MRWNRWKWQAAISGSPSLQTAPSTSEPAFYLPAVSALLRQMWMKSRRRWRVGGGALGSLCENNILTAVLFQTNNIRDNQIKPSRRLPPDSQWRSLWLNLRVLQERTMALVVDRWGFKNKLLDVTSGGSRSDLLFLSICPSLPTVFPHHVRSRIHRSLHSDYR